MGLTLAWESVFSACGGPPVLQWIPCIAIVAALRFVWLNRTFRGLWLLGFGAAMKAVMLLGPP